jgi:heme exporter protein C
MMKNAWKWLGLVLVAYTLIGGLFFPLKTGITGVDKVRILSGETSTLGVDIYNPSPNFKPEMAVLGGKNGFVATHMQYNNNGLLTLTFDARLGKDHSGGLNDLYVKANGVWLAFPSAVSIVKGTTDTGSSNFTTIDVKSNPDANKGFPNRPILNESIRNLLYHVPMWFSMIFILFMAALNAVKHLVSGKLEFDLRSDAFVKTGIVAGLLGCATGSVWASVTWDSWWPRDPKLNGVAIGMLMYLAYLLLRSSIKDDYQRARISAVYNLFVFPIFISLIVIMPKLGGEGLHPGAGGTVGFKQYDLDNTLRMYFYPAVLGWILIYAWVAQLIYRINKLESDFQV